MAEALQKKSFAELSENKVLENIKPILASAAQVAGVKSLYDVPEYLRQKLELRGFKVGGKEFGGGLAGATSSLLEKNQKSKPSDGSSREVRDSITKLNNKLALTKEGSTKHSDARNEMARILRESRSSKNADKVKIHSDVKNVLDKHTTQKVDGMTAAKEALRTGMTLTGTRAFMPVASAALGAVGYGKKVAGLAREEGADFNAKYLAGKFGESARNKWGQAKRLATGNASAEDKVAAMDALGQLGTQSGLLDGTAASAIHAAGTKLNGVGRVQKTPRQNSSAQPTSRVGKAMRRRIEIPKGKNDRNATSARLSLRKKIASDPTGRLQKRYLNKATKLIPNPIAREAARFALKNAKRVKSVAVTVEIFSWATPLWLMLQFPLALFATVAFVLMGQVDGSLKSLIDFFVDLDSIFMALYGIVFILGLITYISMFFQYTLAGVSCLFGKGALFKFSAFIFGLFFYMLPFFHLFPWFMVWAVAVNKNPS